MVIVGGRAISSERGTPVNGKARNLAGANITAVCNDGTTPLTMYTYVHICIYIYICMYIYVYILI